MLLLLRLWHEQDGQDLTEYAFLVAFLALAAISVVSEVANAISAVFASLTANLPVGT